MSARETLTEASALARRCSYNGGNKLVDALADWWRAEAESHFHIGDDEDSTRYVYDLPGMEHTPAVRAARAYLAGEGA